MTHNIHNVTHSISDHYNEFTQPQKDHFYKKFGFALKVGDEAEEENKELFDSDPKRGIHFSGVFIVFHLYSKRKGDVLKQYKDKMLLLEYKSSELKTRLKENSPEEVEKLGDEFRVLEQECKELKHLLEEDFWDIKKDDKSISFP